MPEDSSAEHYQKKKQRWQRKMWKKYRNLSEEGKEKNDNSVVNDWI